MKVAWIALISSLTLVVLIGILLILILWPDYGPTSESKHHGVKHHNK